MNPGYRQNKYCSVCEEVKPFDMIYCDWCHKRVRTKPHDHIYRRLYQL